MKWLPVHIHRTLFQCSSVPVAQWSSIALAAQKVVGSIPREHILAKNV